MATLQVLHLERTSRRVDQLHLPSLGTLVVTERGRGFNLNLRVSEATLASLEKLELGDAVVDALAPAQRLLTPLQLEQTTLLNPRSLESLHAANRDTTRMTSASCKVLYCYSRVF